MSDITEAFENKDNRPQKGGFAAGNYTCKCHACGRCFMGDKRASQCAPCAYLDDYILVAKIQELIDCYYKRIDIEKGNSTVNCIFANVCKELEQLIKPEVSE